MAHFPEAFAELDELADWALPTERARVARRRGASRDELQHFYDLVKPDLERILAHLDTFPLDAMPPAEQQLLDLTLMMAEVAFAVEKYHGDGVVPLAIAPEQFVPIHDLDDGELP